LIAAELFVECGDAFTLSGADGLPLSLPLLLLRATGTALSLDNVRAPTVAECCAGKARERGSGGVAENGIQQRAIFGAQPVDLRALTGDLDTLPVNFPALPANFRTLPRDLRLLRAHVRQDFLFERERDARSRNSPP